MPRYPVYPPNWPPENPETEGAIGRFVIAWGMLETQIDEAIGDIFCLDHSLQSSISANLGTKSKIEIFLSAFHVDSGLFPAGLLETVNKLGHDTATAAGVYRTWVVHGAPFRLKLDEFDLGIEDEKKWIWAKLAARKGGVQGSFAFFTKEIFDKHTLSVRELLTRWHSIRERMAPHLESVARARADSEDTCEPLTHVMEIPYPTSLK